MSVSDYARFLSECITYDPAKESGLREDEMYGVYLSWCFLNGEKPGSSKAFWGAMSREGHGRNHRGAGRYVLPGLAMTGTAAVDYILSSRPSLV